MRRVTVGTCAGVLMLSALIGAQKSQEPSSNTKPPGRGDPITVKGCLQGPMLVAASLITTDDTGRVATPLTFQLKGDKKELKKLHDEHEGALVQIDGILKSTLPQDSAPHAKQIGRTKVSFGIGTPSAQSGAPDLTNPMPVLEVKSYLGLAARCNS